MRRAREGGAAAAFYSNEFAWIQNAFWIEAFFYPAVQGAQGGGCGQGPPAFLGQPDAVFAGNDSVPGQHLAELVVQGPAGARFHARPSLVIHLVDVDVAVAGVPETGHREIEFFLKAGGEGKEVLQPAARHGDVLV